MTQNVENLNTYTYALLIKLQNRKNTKCSKHVWFHWYLQFSMISPSFQVHNFVRVFICWMKMKFMSCIILRDFCDAKNAKCKNEKDSPDKQMFDKIRGIFSCLLHSMRIGLPNAYHLSLRTLRAKKIDHCSQLCSSVHLLDENVNHDLHVVTRFIWCQTLKNQPKFRIWRKNPLLLKNWCCTLECTLECKAL